ncbi:MAG: helix-turn-helix transcriptional regulator [Alphaproteobacteria bacterium]|nr:helix-turn-helix transcriptional regulator [Alphaproteobacteria bacterium]
MGAVQRTIYSKEDQYFISLLVKARLAVGVTQAELALLLEKPQSFVSKYENGQRRLDIIEFITVYRVLKVDARKIFNQLLRYMR